MNKFNQLLDKFLGQAIVVMFIFLSTLFVVNRQFNYMEKQDEIRKANTPLRIQIDNDRAKERELIRQARQEKAM